jgi:hypothetical protein
VLQIAHRLEIFFDEFPAPGEYANGALSRVGKAIDVPCSTVCASDSPAGFVSFFSDQIEATQSR